MGIPLNLTTFINGNPSFLASCTIPILVNAKNKNGTETRVKNKANGVLVFALTINLLVCLGSVSFMSEVDTNQEDKYLDLILGGEEEGE